ncbi:MAG: HD domain-containing protein [Candidatus Omnitrophica bacterium]|nr:HD domain-containing protein [Candidatus Omnitrophota bacterium]MBD3268935.1 HD domain-containing protein [Candidatus Omnitrophota bacterium]
MLNKQLLLKIYEAASMQRWNDQIRTVELTELDKQAHKMIIAYVLGKCEEERGNRDFNWIEIIEGGIFEFLQRIILTDLKPPLFHRIKEDRKKYEELNCWVYERIKGTISVMGEDFCRRFKSYLLDTERNVNRRIISAAHFYATKWEFNIIERANPGGYLIEEIKEDIQFKQDKYHDLQSMQRLLQSEELKDFIDICAQLRFQIRWSHIHRVPKTSVLGHMLIVAILSYLFSLKVTSCYPRLVNNFFTGLFHDLPEVLTRDVINPVKRSVEGLKDLIKDYEKEEMERKIYKLLPPHWHKDMRVFTEDEFNDITSRQGKPLRDGLLVKAIDDLAAFIEAHLSLVNGVRNQALEGAIKSISGKYKSSIICGINFEDIYSQFSQASG